MRSAIPLSLFVGSLLAAQTGLSVSGTVTDVTGVPIPNAIALLTSNSAAGERYIGHTDATGVYRLSVSASGFYTLELQAAGFTTRRIGPIELPAGSQKSIATAVLQIGSFSCLRSAIDPSDLRLLPAGTSTGALAGEFRLDIPGSSKAAGHAKGDVRIILANARGEVLRTTTVKAGANFQFADLPAGAYKLQTTGDDFYPENWDVTVRQDLETQYVFPLGPCLKGHCAPSERFKGQPPTICM
jgi:hypothetical protein